MEVWRLQRSVHLPLDGEGARKFGGRWNAPGRPVVYTSESLALSVLEMLVHLDSDLFPFDYAAYRIYVPDDVVQEEVRRDLLPGGWRQSAASRECRRAGDAWLDRGESAILKLPTSVLPHGSNYLLNPRHDDAASIRVLSTEPFHFDPRLL